MTEKEPTTLREQVKTTFFTFYEARDTEYWTLKNKVLVLIDDDLKRQAEERKSWAYEVKVAFFQSHSNEPTIRKIGIDRMRELLMLESDTKEEK